MLWRSRLLVIALCATVMTGTLTASAGARTKTGEANKPASGKQSSRSSRRE